MQILRQLQPLDADLTTLASAGLAGALSGFLFGCTLSNNSGDATNDIDVAAGKCIDSTNAALISCAAMTKRLDANWAVGTNQGFRNSAIAIADTTYHIYAVWTAAGVQDYYAHTSATVATVITALQAETGGASYIYARRIGSILRESAALVAFSQDGDEFLRLAQAAYTATNPGTSAVLAALGVPLGLKVRAIVAIRLQDATPTAATRIIITSPDQTDVAASASVFTAISNSADLETCFTDIVRTDTSAQIRYRQESAETDITVQIKTRGWIDTRGRLA